MNATVAPRAAFGYRDFRRYVASSLLSNLGAQMLGVAVGWQIYSIALHAGLLSRADPWPDVPRRGREAAARRSPH